MASRNRYHVYHDLDRKAQDYTEIVIAGFNENSSSQRGKTVHRICIEEVVDVPEEHYLTSIRSDLGPALLHSKNGKIVYFTTPPKYPNHPFIVETLAQARLDDALSVFTIDDNIALSPEQKAKAIKLAGGPNSVDTLREYYCQIVRDPSVVCLPDYNASVNVRTFGLPNSRIMQTTIDWGGVRDKTCAVIHTYDYLANEDLYWDELVFEPNTSTARILEGVRQMEEAHHIVHRNIDAPAQLLIDIMQEHKMDCRMPQKDDWQSAVNAVNVRFQERRAFIHPRCKFLQLSAESGHFNKNKTDLDRNKVLGHMDGIAALMYANRMMDRTSPYSEQNSAFDYLQSNQIPVRSEDTHQASSTAQVIVPRAFGKFRGVS